MHVNERRVLIEKCDRTGDFFDYPTAKHKRNNHDGPPKWFINRRRDGVRWRKKKEAFDSLENGVHAYSFEQNHSRSAIDDEKKNKPKYR